FRAYGQSMLPTVYPGDVLTVHRRKASTIEPGDIVVYVRQNRLFAHRVVKKENVKTSIELVTRGDALTQFDPPVHQGEILGCVSAIARGDKKFAPGKWWSPSFLVARAISHFDGAARLLLRWHAMRCEPQHAH